MRKVHTAESSSRSRTCATCSTREASPASYATTVSPAWWARFRSSNAGRSCGSRAGRGATRRRLFDAVLHPSTRPSPGVAGAAGSRIEGAVLAVLALWGVPPRRGIAVTIADRRAPLQRSTGLRQRRLRLRRCWRRRRGRRARAPGRAAAALYAAQVEHAGARASWLLAARRTARDRGTASKLRSRGAAATATTSRRVWASQHYAGLPRALFPERFVCGPLAAAATDCGSSRASSTAASWRRRGCPRIRSTPATARSPRSSTGRRSTARAISPFRGPPHAAAWGDAGALDRRVRAGESCTSSAGASGRRSQALRRHGDLRRRRGAVRSCARDVDRDE